MKLFGRATPGESLGNGVLEGHRVDLKIRGVGRTAGQVKAVADESVLIELVVAPGADAVAMGEPDAIIEYTAARGLYRQRGSARFDVNGKVMVRFLPREEPELLQRRDFVRVDVNIPVKVSFKGSPWPLEFDALNLSANGMLIIPADRRPSRLQVGMFIWVTIPLYDGKDPIEVRGTVVRQATATSVGVRFDHISESHQERLAHFVARQEREQRRKGRL